MRRLLSWFLLDHGWSPNRVDLLTRIFRRRTPMPSNPCIERLASDLRRLTACLRDPAPRSAIRERALVAAYEQTLRQACAALEIRHRLDRLSGLDRDLERILIEGELQAAGLVTRR